MITSCVLPDKHAPTTSGSWSSTENCTATELSCDRGSVLILTVVFVVDVLFFWEVLFKIGKFGFCY